ncbi:NAD-dependent epimerase/dehydratase family protein [Agromyces sp. NPDC057679]|uniref:NAD-dependent epimerase/dehydratase family protein n=1 Tax=Agromyces sp. NPDC057679 TaxID=3346207 RepID=UPI003670C3EB
MTPVDPRAEDLAGIHERFTSRAALRDSTVVVTGAGGFLGYYLVGYLVEYAAELGLAGVIAVDNGVASEEHWLARLAARNPRLEVVVGDAAAFARGRLAELRGRVHLVHAASIASPTTYRQFPLETIDANVWGLRAMLDAAREADLGGFLFYSSSEIYGDPPPEAIPTPEDYLGNVSCVGPRACYDESKRIGETLCWVYATQFGMPVTVVRPFNNFGPGMRPTDRRLPADLAARVLAGEDLELFSSGAPSRTFCYVADAVVGYLLALTHGRYDCFNIGADRPELSVEAFAERFRAVAAELLGYRGSVVRRISDDPDYLTGNPQRRCPDLSKARAVLGYEPRVEVDAGIARFLSHLVLERDGATA